MLCRIPDAPVSIGREGAPVLTVEVLTGSSSDAPGSDPFIDLVMLVSSFSLSCLSLVPRGVAVLLTLVLYLL